MKEKIKKTKKSKYIHLITIGEAEAKMLQGLLWKQGIPSRLRLLSHADVFSAYGVQANIPCKMLVPEESLKKAKELLNINNK